MRRLVVLTGTAQLNILVGNAFNYEKPIGDALANAGFDVIAVRITKPLLFANQINISIEINVDEIYSAEQARINATAILASIPGESYAYYSSGLLSNVNLSILKDGGPQTANEDTTHNEAVSNIVRGIGNATTDAITGLGSNSFLPLAAAAVVIVLLLKRK